MAGLHNDADFLLHGAGAAVMKTEWEVEYSRFFSYPRFRRSSFSSLRRLPECRTRASRGIWLSSASPASLLLLSPSAILSLSVLGEIYEEHFVSNLHFSWPQVSCETDCPVRGSKVLFASFMDSEAQIQKFALRFSKGCDVQLFLNAVKETVKAQFDIKFGTSNFECEISSQSEYIASNAFRHTIDEQSGFAGLNVGDQSEIPIVEVEEEKPEGSQYPSLDNYLANDFSAVPSFTELLTGCMSGDVTKEPPEVPEGIDLKSQVTSYVSDSSFHGIYIVSFAGTRGYWAQNCTGALMVEEESWMIYSVNPSITVPWVKNLVNSIAAAIEFFDRKTAAERKIFATVQTRGAKVHGLLD